MDEASEETGNLKIYDMAFQCVYLSMYIINKNIYVLEPFRIHQMALLKEPFDL